MLRCFWRLDLLGQSSLTDVFYTFHTDCHISWVTSPTGTVPVCVSLCSWGHFYSSITWSCFFVFIFLTRSVFPLFQLIGPYKKLGRVISLGTKTIRPGPCWGGGLSTSHCISEVRSVCSEDEIRPPSASAAQPPNTMNEAEAILENTHGGSISLFKLPYCKPEKLNKTGC